MNNKYQLSIDYYTGDSFGSRDEVELLDGTWEDLDILKENIRRIVEHNDWYCSVHKQSENPLPRPAWLKDGIPDASITLLLDNRKEYQISTFWCGYFEGLYGVTAVHAESDLPSFEY